MTPVEVLINAALADRSRNLFAQHGPRCPQCSGLGYFLRMGTDGNKTREASKCQCKGSGLDLELLRAEEIVSLYQRVDALELALAQKRQRAGLSSRTGKAGKMSRQYWMEMIAWATADGTAVANSTTETILMPNITIPANYMQDGRAIRQTVYGRVGWTTGSPTIRYRVRWGGVSGTVIWDTGTMTATSSAVTAAVLKLLIVTQTRVNGSSGTLFSTGDAVVGSGAAPTVGSATGAPAFGIYGSAGDDTPAAVTVDLTADTALSVTATWSAANAANTTTGHNYWLESMN